jgi:hypothetical protein
MSDMAAERNANTNSARTAAIIRKDKRRREERRE